MPERPPEGHNWPARWYRQQADKLMRPQVEAAMRHFQKTHVPGVEYALESKVDTKGCLILTWSPKC